MIQVNFVVCYSFFRPVQSNIFPTTESTRSFSRIISSIIIVSPVMGSFLNHIKLLHYGIGTNTASKLILLFRKCSKSKAKCPKSAYKKYNPKKKWSTGCSPALGTEGMRLSSSLAPTPTQHLADYLGQTSDTVFMIKWISSGFQTQ